MEESESTSMQDYFTGGKKIVGLGGLIDQLEKILEDNDKNGILDIFERKEKLKPGQHIIINGKKYTSWEEVPEQYKKAISFALSKVGFGSFKMIMRVYRQFKEVEIRDILFVAFVIAFLGYSVYYFYDKF